ncbi:hypothetical protein UCRPC4_g01907 [Phaeomoniella chlamydospora]|uniref:Duf895 domain membrane protein n=1 Tax=Phaeomoniella chlamydospora TaxID=158046 RepID=A0A0G2GPH7_PHACM|nr:hypothetical protein UCRPC4_g01907 [Phaeomoniella chlamydospora]
MGIRIGMYNVITFIGGAGQQTAYLSDVANIALYTVFTVFCLIAPACLNFFGLRATLCFGGFGYAAYAASLWCYNHTGNVPFVIFGGCWCGLSAAFLWTAEGTAITAFASEDKKGLYVSIFWSIFQFGVVIGAAIPVGQNWNAGTSNGSRVGDGTYVGLFVLMLCGAFLGLAMYPWQRIVREDGSRVMLERQKTFKEELISSYQVCRKNPWILFFWPMCWAVNYYVVYQNNDFNGIVFTVRGRALNTLLSAIVQIAAAWVLNLFTDKLPMKRRKRAFWAVVYVFVAFNALSVYAAMYRLLNAACQICAYGLDLQGYSKEFMFGTSWAFVAAGPIFVLPIIKWWLKDTNMVESLDSLDGQEVPTDTANVPTFSEKPKMSE